MRIRLGLPHPQLRGLNGDFLGRDALRAKGKVCIPHDALNEGRR